LKKTSLVGCRTFLHIVFSEKATASLGALVRSLGESLQHFEFDWCSPRLTNIVNLPEDFTIEQCTSLETLTIRCPVLHQQHLPWITSLLSRITSPHLRTVVLEIRLLGDLDSIDWNGMGQVLRSPSFRSLETLIFKILVWPTASIWTDEVESSVLSRLPDLKSKGIIQFENEYHQ